MHYPSKKRRRLIRGLYTNDMDCSCNENATIRHAYNCWHRMIERCHNPKYQETCSTYIGCSICDEWKNFSNFFEWYKVNHKDGCELDKDILVKGNKVYSPETCCFVPQEINKLIIQRNKKRGKLPIGVYEPKKGVFLAQMHKNGKTVAIGTFHNANDAFLAYKQKKELYVKEVAKEYYDKGVISHNIYLALLNFDININD